MIHKLAFALLLPLGAPLLLAAPVAEIVPVWPEGVPGQRTDLGEEYVQDGRIHNVHTPTLTVFRPSPGPNARVAALICPGGGYTRLANTNEGNGMATWLNSLGITCFVLKYRLKEYGHPAPLRDVLQAIRLIRSQAADFGIDPDRIGVFGSSAGGHLASCAATLFDHPDGRTGTALEGVSARPTFVVLLYPVILMDGPHAHRGSRDNLIGKTPTPDQSALLSTDRQVSAATPPAFLVHTAEDTSVPLENSLAYFGALRRAGVPAELHLYEKGAHGFGLRKGLGPTSAWPERCAEWMRSHGWIQ